MGIAILTLGMLLVVAVGLELASEPQSLPGTQPTPTGPAVVATSPATHSSTGAPTPSRTGAAGSVRLGVFRGTSVDGVDEFAAWLGGSVDYALDFSARKTWADIADPQYMLDEWRNSEYRMVYAVALLPTDEPGSMRAGAQGRYDKHFRRLARNLVAAGQKDAILRLGWEFNLNTWPWSTGNEQAFIRYWRHVVTAMRSVPGQRFQFDWNVNVGDTAHDAYRYYPGPKYVDYVGVDVYDVSWTPETYPYDHDCSDACQLARRQVVWDRLHGGRYGLLYWADFARARGKRMSLPEWGLWRRPDGHGGGDNAYFIEQMHAFVDDPRNRVAYQGSWR